MANKTVESRPYRVLIIVENLPVPFDRRVWSEAKTLIGAGYDVSIICPKGKDAATSFEVIDGVHIFRHSLPTEARRGFGYIAEYGVALFWEFVLSVKVLHQRGFDVIHACNPPDLIFLIGGFYKYLFGKRFVFDHHDLNPELYEAKFGKRDAVWRALTTLERWTFAIADISIATNESYRATAIERGRMASNRVFVVRSGPDLNRVRLVEKEPSWKRERSFVVAYVGVIGAQEGLDLLLAAIQHIRFVRHREDIQFVVVGGGTELEAIKKSSKDLHVEDMTTFTGRVDDATLFSVLSTADVCVNPDRPNVMNDRSTMNKIMEYMALGKPIVQFDLKEGRVSAGDASLYAQNTEDFGNKILELLDDPDKRRRMGELGQQRVINDLAWKHEAPKLLEAYASVFGTVAKGREVAYG